MATTIAAAALGGGLGLASTILNNQFANDLAWQDRYENFKYNEQSAENAYRRQIAYTENYLTPQAQVQQLKNAGLSVGLMYGGATNPGGATGPQGNGASGPRTQQYPYDLGSLMTLAQIDNLNANTEKTKAEAETEAGKGIRGEAEVSNIIANTAGTDAATANTKADTKLKEIETYIGDSTKEMKIETISHNTDEAYENAKFAGLKVAEKMQDIQIKQQTMQDVIKQASLRTTEMANNLVLQRKYVDLTNAQVNEIVNGIKQRWEEILIKKGEFNVKKCLYELEKSKYQFEKFKFQKTKELEVEMFNKGIDFEAHKIKTQQVIDVTTKFGTALIYGGLLKGAAKGIVQPAQTPVHMQPITIPTQFNGTPVW